MTRKVLALLVVAIVFGLAPVTAMIGFCAKMPCCFGETKDGPATAVNRADCCSTISCYEVPPHDLTVDAKATKVLTGATTAVQSARMSVAHAVTAGLSFDDTSPPPTTSERLSSLSVFLI